MVWYHDDVQEAIAQRRRCPYNPQAVFYGSSSIRLWETLYDDFKEYKPVNLGFGGSTLSACVWFFNEIVGPVKSARKFILYAGDNDLGDGRHPEEILIFYKQFLAEMRRQFKKAPLYFISIKPSVSREGILDKIIYTNKLIEEDIKKSRGNEIFINIFANMITGKGQPLKRLFDEDGLHLNKRGYEVWKEALLKECFWK